MTARDERPCIRFVVGWPQQGEFRFRSPTSELVLSDVYWLWIYEALLEMREDDQQVPFVRAVEEGFQDPANLVETIPVSPRFLELLEQITPTQAPSFAQVVSNDGSPAPSPQQILTAFGRLVRESLSSGQIEMEIE